MPGILFTGLSEKNSQNYQITERGLHMSRITLPIIYQDHMMLQREKDILVQGTCASGSSVTLLLDTVKRTTAVADGKFQCILPPQTAGRHKALLFFVDREDIPDLIIEDISIGDIWLAAGQSNMEFFLRYDAHWNTTKGIPRNEDIHMFQMPRIAFEGQKRCLPDSGYWFQEGDKAWASFSAPGYSFSRNLQPHLGVPVGIIGCNWGGTPACAWIKEDYLSQEPLTLFQKEYQAEVTHMSPKELEIESMRCWAFEDSYRHQLEWRSMMYGLTLEEQQFWMKEHKKDPVLPMGPYHHYRPSGLYHTMVEKLAPFSLKGILWYQGESDSGHAAIYDSTMEALIQCFRDTFQDSSLPFLFAQLAPFGVWLDCTGEHYEIIREKQDYVSRHVRNTAMISLMDLGMYEDIHPKFKMEVGHRFALLARGNVYGEQLLCESPEIASITLKSHTLILKCSHSGDGLYTVGAPEKEFRLLCDDEACQITQCDVMSNQIILTFRYPESARTGSGDDSIESSCPTGKTLILSYAYQPYCNGNIWNSIGLPLKPYRQLVALSR